MMRFTLTAEPVDLALLRDGRKHPGSGGFCAFEGWVRNNNEGREVSGLEYEAYTELANNLPQDARQFFHEGMQQMDIIGYPEHVREVVAKFERLWGADSTLH